MSVITVSEVTKVYNPDKIPVKAVNGVSFTVKKGEFIAVIGPSGSGKSTLLNMVGGLDRPTSGEVEVGGHKLNDMSEKELIKRNNRPRKYETLLHYFPLYFHFLSITFLISNKGHKCNTEHGLSMCCLVFSFCK